MKWRGLTMAAAMAIATGHAHADGRFMLSSPGLADKATLDSRHAASANDCGGGNVSPELDWRGVPDDTKRFAMTICRMDDNCGR
jgi:phosphatidylethanolamine-binding protein (PEBP) family uncharacterized protein